MTPSRATPPRPGLEGLRIGYFRVWYRRSPSVPEYVEPVEDVASLIREVEAVCDAYGDKGWAKSEMVRRLRAALARLSASPAPKEGER